jgi:spore protease
LRIETAEAGRRLGRPVGEYITLHCGKLWKMERTAEAALEEELASQVVRLVEREMGRRVMHDISVLVVGLGNRAITADALGPTAVDRLLVTRHLREQEPDIFRKMECCAVSALAPGVLGQTGMEVADVIAGAVRRAHTDVVIAIDALAARDCDRLAATVQLSDTGISPGSGIGNDRGALTRESLGLPVIALGIPTVVDSSTLVWDALCRAGIHQVSGRLNEILENGRRFYVSPKEADLINERTACLVARALNRAFVGVSGV